MSSHPASLTTACPVSQILVQVKEVLCKLSTLVETTLKEVRWGCGCRGQGRASRRDPRDPPGHPSLLHSVPGPPTCLPPSLLCPLHCVLHGFSWSVVTSHPSFPSAPSPLLSLGPSLSGGLFSFRQRRLQCAGTPMASSMTSSTYLSSTVYPQRPTPMYPQR